MGAFDKWSASQFCLRADRLGPGTDFKASQHPKAAPISWAYDEVMKAARSTHAPVCPAQLRLRLDQKGHEARVRGVTKGRYIVAFPILVPESWGIAEPSTYTDPKTNKKQRTNIVSKFLNLSCAPELHWLEMRLKAMTGAGGKVIGFKGGVKCYGRPVGGATEGPGEYGAGGDASQPMRGPLEFYFGRWTYTIQEIEVSGGPVDLYSLWTIDRDRGQVQVYDRLPIEHGGAYNGVWMQFGGEYLPPTAPVRHRYVREVVQLLDAPIDDVLADYRSEAQSRRQFM